MAIKSYNINACKFVLWWLFVVGVTVLGENVTCVTHYPQGAARGVLMTSLFGRQFCGYLGIPYAKPPIGDLRFSDPEPPIINRDVISATTKPKLCIGILSHQNSSDMDEDCLYLTIFTPQLVNVSKGKDILPVLVFIPDDSFPSNESYMYGPDYLMDQDLLLVVMNYRVGALGFLSTENFVALGNYGLKDQVRALIWIKENIRAFGGNPNIVTIYGHGNGAASVHYHILSPMSTGLFHRAISQSGSAFNPNMRVISDPRRLALELGQKMNCNTTDDVRLITCLRRINQTEFLKIGSTDFAPTVERNATQLKFLPQTPLEILKSGRINKVPWLMGTVSDEGGTAAIGLLENKSAVYVWNNNSDDILVSPYNLRLLDDQFLYDGHWTKVLDFYLGKDNHQINESRTIDLVKLYGDRLYNFGMHMSAAIHSLFGHSDIFKYNFAVNCSSHYKKLPKDAYKFIDANHGDDLLYIFKLPMLETFPPGHPETEVIIELTEILSSFANYGIPTSLSNVTWVPVGSFSKSNKHIEYMDMRLASPGSNRGLNLTMKQDIYRNRMSFWELLPLYENEFLSYNVNRSAASYLLPTNIIIIVISTLLALS